MNKQIVIAGLLGSALGATACDDPFVAAAKLKKAAREADKITFAADLVALEALAAKEATAYTTALGRVTAQQTILTPFQTALTTATTNHGTQSGIVTAANAQITTITAAITAADTKLTAAKALETAQNTKISDQKAIVAKLDKALADHKAEKVILDAAAAAAIVTLNAADSALSTLNTSKTTAQGTIDKALTGWQAVATAKATAITTPTSEYNSAVSDETTKETAWKAAQKLASYDEALRDTIVIGCDSALLCGTNGADDQINKYMIAAQTTFTGAANGTGSAGTKGDLGTKKSAWDSAVALVATKQDLKVQADIEKAVADADLVTAKAVVTGLDTQITAATTTKTTATTAKTTAETNVTTVDGQITQATTDQTRGAALLTKEVAALVPLANDVVVKTYLKKVQEDMKVAEEKKKTDANANLADLASLKTMAQETVTRAQLKMTFYSGLLSTATSSKALADGAVTKCKAKIAANDAAIVKATSGLAAAVAACKGAGYKKAQEAIKNLEAKRAADKTTATTVATEYAKKTKQPVDGEANMFCNFPAAKADGTQDPRPKCKDGNCCGAAQKFLRDGTKLSVETCQKATGVHTYTYYPPLPANAIVEPTPETWRFQCISGAQKLAAAATAALAASYMMA